MRIGLNLHYLDGRISGVDYYALGVLRAMLCAAPWNDYITFTNRPDVIRAHVPASDRLRLIEVRHIRNRVARVLFEQLELPMLAERHGLDILHCTSYVAPLRRMSVPYIVTIHDTIALDHPQWCRRGNALYYGLTLAASARRARHVIAVSSRTASDLRYRLGLPPARIMTIYPGIDEIFRPGWDRSAQERVRARYGLPDRYLLWVGNIEPKKNVGALVRLITGLRQKGLSQRLVVVGGRLWRAGPVLRDLRRESGRGNLVMTGYVERQDLPLVYAMADVFVFPSWYEGFGFPPLEAMACGVPVVSSDRGALKETLGSAAWLVDPRDDEQILVGVCTLLARRDVHAQYAEAGLLRSRLFRWDRAAAATIAVYEKVVARSHSQARADAGFEAVPTVSRGTGVQETRAATPAQ